MTLPPKQLSDRDQLTLNRMVRDYGKPAVIAAAQGVKPQRGAGRPKRRFVSLDLQQLVISIDEVAHDLRQKDVRGPLARAQEAACAALTKEGKPVSLETLKRRYGRGREQMKAEGIAPYAKGGRKLDNGRP